MSEFDPNQFLEQSTDQAMEERFSPIPEGEYRAVIVDDPDNENRQIRIREVNTRFGPGYVMDVPLQVDSPDNELANQKHVRWSSFLDFSPENGFEFGPNKNVKLGQLRSAVGQNEPGQAWKPKDLGGQIVRVTVKHDAEGRYANVEEVAAAA